MTDCHRVRAAIRCVHDNFPLQSLCSANGQALPSQSWQPQQAVSAETISMAEALNRWNVQACYVDDLDALIARLNKDGIYFDEQT
jgi:hypothetical protein